MSLDAQADVARASGETVIQTCDFEELKEASDETSVAETRLLVAGNENPDFLNIPLNRLNLQSRSSNLPGKDMLPFQHILRSFTDFHLCIKNTIAPCCTLSSPIRWQSKDQWDQWRWLRRLQSWWNQ